MAVFMEQKKEAIGHSVLAIANVLKKKRIESYELYICRLGRSRRFGY